MRNFLSLYAYSSVQQAGSRAHSAERALLRVTSRTALSAVLLTLLAVQASPSWAQEANATAAVPSDQQVRALPEQQVPQQEVLVILVQSTLLALNHANLTNDYSVMMKLSAGAMQTPQAAAQYSTGFAGFRENRIDMAPVLIYQPEWVYTPVIQDGLLRLVGRFPTRPQEVAFDLSYIYEGNKWHVAVISVDIRDPA